MKLVWLCWYISGMLALLFVFSLLSTYAPGAERLAQIVQAATGSGALITSGLAVCLHRLPHDHWVNRSKPLWAGLIFVAVTLTVLVLPLLVG
jgi:hypothetical protein